MMMMMMCFRVSYLYVTLIGFTRTSWLSYKKKSSKCTRVSWLSTPPTNHPINHGSPIHVVTDTHIAYLQGLEELKYTREKRIHDARLFRAYHERIIDNQFNRERMLAEEECSVSVCVCEREREAPWKRYSFGWPGWKLGWKARNAW